MTHGHARSLAADGRLHLETVTGNSAINLMGNNSGMRFTQVQLGDLNLNTKGADTVNVASSSTSSSSRHNKALLNDQNFPARLTSGEVFLYPILGQNLVGKLDVFPPDDLNFFVFQSLVVLC
mgnify:CR=1 FL=1